VALDARVMACLSFNTWLGFILPFWPVGGVYQKPLIGLSLYAFLGSTFM